MPERIKVLHVIKSLGRGGAEMLLPETLKLHDHSRFEFHYIYFLPWKNQMVNAICENGGRVTCLSASNNIKIVFKINELRRYVKKHSISIVHCHLPWAGVIGRLLYKLAVVQVMYTEHNKQERYHWVTRWMNNLTFNSQNLVVAVSNDVANSIKKNINPKVPIYVIPNGVNAHHFQRDQEAGNRIKRELEIPEDALVVGNVAVFRFQKRLKEWLAIFALLSIKHPQLYGILVGDGPLKAELISEIKKLGLEKKVIMVGLQTEVRPWLSAMDVFMMSSIFEGMPVALLEAMSMKCAIVTTDAGGVKEVVRHKENGLMVAVARWPQLELELDTLLLDPIFRRQLGESARKSVEENFDLKSMTERLERLYEDHDKPVFRK